MGLRRVLDVEFDGGSVTATFGRHQIPIIKSNYADLFETEVVRSMGSQEQDARTPGIYKTETAGITFRNSVFRVQFMPLMPVNGGGNTRIPIVISFSHPEIGDDSDLLKGARLVNLAAAMDAAAKGLEVETKWELSQIFWSSRRITINNIVGAPPPGVTQF